MLLVSEYDKRTYMPLVLPNGLSVLIVHDPEARKSALSTTIAAGHFNDPDNCHGAAHLLEHMLFLGSKHFPEANGINQFMSSQGGNINAWTGTEYSNFHFEIIHEMLPEAMCRFADMLISPLFDKKLIDKEIQAIDAEFKLKQKDDLRRLYQVHKETCNPAHPFSKFSVGNEQTLRANELDTLHGILETFHNDFYIAKNMCLCLISTHPLNECKELIEQFFGNLPDSEKRENKEQAPLYLPEQLAIKIDIQPIKQARRLILSFALPDTQAFYRTKPVGLISHILGDEGKGSLLAYFKSKNWATSLSAGGGIQGVNFKDFNLNLQLTESGLSRLEEILNCIFYHLTLIQQQIAEPWRFMEKKRLSQLAFDFSDAVKTIDEATHISNQMFYYPIEHVISGDYLHDRMDFDVIQHCLSYMTPDNMRLKLIHPDAKVNKQAKWYDTPYSVTKLSSSLLEQLANPTPVEELSLPEANPYIVKDTQLQPLEPKYEFPVKIVDNPEFSLWFAQDHKFKQPKGDCFLSFDCALTHQGVEMAAYKRLWVAIMMEHFNNNFYQAGVAGLHYHLYTHQAGFSLHTNGFSQKQLALCKELISQLQSPVDLGEYFPRVQAKHTQALQNSLLNKPINRLFSRLSVIMQRYSYAPADMLKHVESALPEQVQQVQGKLFSGYYLEGFIHGDWRLDQCSEMAEFLSTMTSNTEQTGKISRDVADLRDKGRFLHQVDSQHDDAAAIVYFQAPNSHTNNIAKSILIEQLISGPFFNQMRTEKQLGYLVGSGYMPYNQHPGIALYIQSPTAPAPVLLHEIQSFLTQVLTDLSIFRDIWSPVKASVIKQLAENDTNLSMKSQRLWMAIGNEDTELSLQNKLAAAVMEISLEQLQEFCTDLLNRNGFGEVQLYCSGKFSENVKDDSETITDLNHFKQHSNYTI